MEMLGQDRVLDRPEERRMDAHRKQRDQHQRDRQRVDLDPLPRQQQARRAHGHDPDFAGLDDADDARLVAHVGQLARDRRQRHEGHDEQRRGQPREARFGLLGIVDVEHHEQNHGVLEQVVVERAQQLRDEQGQKAARAEEMRRGGHSVMVPSIPVFPVFALTPPKRWARGKHGGSSFLLGGRSQKPLQSGA
jgi:hypothetical protein